MTPLHIMALRHSAFYSPLLLTIAAGYLRAEGLDPQYRVATPERSIPDQLAAGACHVAQSAVATSFAALERGEAPATVHFAQINQRDGFFLVGRRPQPEFRWTDLRGRSVVIDHFFQPLAMLRYGLHRQGVSLEDLTAMDAGGPDDMARAFRSGQGDYVHLQGPAAQQLEHEGAGYVVAAVGDAVGPVAFSSLCARRDWLATDMARAFLRAYRRARDFANTAPPAEIAASEHAAGFFQDVHPDVLARTVAAYQQLGCWGGDVAIARREYETLLDVFQFDGLVHRRHPYEELVMPPPDVDGDSP